jgi:hypothetical protein
LKVIVRIIAIPFHFAEFGFERIMRSRSTSYVCEIIAGLFAGYDPSIEGKKGLQTLKLKYFICYFSSNFPAFGDLFMQFLCGT